MTEKTTLRYSQASDTPRRLARGLWSLGVVCGAYATVAWYVVQDAPAVAGIVAGLTVLLVGLTAVNERYGSDPLYA